MTIYMYLLLTEDVLWPVRKELKQLGTETVIIVIMLIFMIILLSMAVAVMYTSRLVLQKELKIFNGISATFDCREGRKKGEALMFQYCNQMEKDMDPIHISKKGNQDSTMKRITLRCQRRIEKVSQGFTDSMHWTLKLQIKMVSQIYLTMKQMTRRESMVSSESSVGWDLI